MKEALPTKATVSRNYEFDFWKFIAAVFVVLVHSYSLFDGEFLVFHQGRLAVEYFFFVTGFLFANTILRDERPFSRQTIGNETWRFMWRKIQAFLLYYIAGFALSLLSLSILCKFTLRTFKNHPDVVFDFLLLKETGIPFFDIMGVNWYLSSMLIALFILYPVFRFLREMFLDWLAPILGIVCIGYLFMSKGVVNHGNAVQLGFLTAGTVRAIGDICLGVLCYRIAGMISNSCKGKFHQNVLSVVGLGAMILACFFMSMVKTPHHQNFIIFLMFVFVCISGSQRSSVSGLYPPKLSLFLGKLSLSLFLSHSSIRWLMLFISKHYSPLAMLLRARDSKSIAVVLAIYLSASIVLALIVLVFCEPLQKKFFSSQQKSISAS